MGKRLVAGVTFLFFVFSLFLATVARAEVGMVGEKMYLVSKNGADIPLAINEKAHKELWDAVFADDDYGVARMFLTGEAFYVKSRTNVLILHAGWVRTRVRVLDGKRKGMSGWVPSGDLLRSSPYR